MPDSPGSATRDTAAGEQPIRSECCNVPCVFVHPTTHKFVAVWPSDPDAQRAEWFCGGCNRRAALYA